MKSVLIYVVFSFLYELQQKVQELLKNGWLKLPEDDKEIYREWTEWDKKRYARDDALYKRLKASVKGKNVELDTDDMKTIHVPKKRKDQLSGSGGDNTPVPKKRKP